MHIDICPSRVRDGIEAYIIVLLQEVIAKTNILEIRYV